MARIVQSPTIVQSAGKGKKLIEEYFGKVSTSQKDISIAVMTADEGWEEPGQIAQFNEYVYVISGTVFIRTKKSDFIVKPKQAILIDKGEWVQFSTPFKYGANYIAICTPAFQPKLVKRDGEGKK